MKSELILKKDHLVITRNKMRDLLSTSELKRGGCKMNISVTVVTSDLQFSVVNRRNIGMYYYPILYKMKSFQTLSFLHNIQKIQKNSLLFVGKIDKR